LLLLCANVIFISPGELIGYRIFIYYSYPITLTVNESGQNFFWTVLALDVWHILVAEQPSSEEWHITIQSESCHDLKDEDYDHGILCAMDSLYRIVYVLKLVHRFKLVYSFKVVYRLGQSLACLIP
jgi:hypothetical protein